MFFVNAMAMPIDSLCAENYFSEDVAIQVAEPIWFPKAKLMALAILFEQLVRDGDVAVDADRKNG